MMIDEKIEEMQGKLIRIISLIKKEFLSIFKNTKSRPFCGSVFPVPGLLKNPCINF